MPYRDRCGTGVCPNGATPGPWRLRPGFACDADAMNDDELRAFLCSLPRLRRGVPSGYVAIASLSVQDAGGDPAAVSAWVQRHGGTIVRRRIVSKSLGVGPWRRQHTRTSHYLIPASELPATS